MGNLPTMIIVDDDQDMGAFIGDVARLSGFEVEVSTSPQRLLEAAPEEMPDVIVLDLVMPDVDGMELIRTLSMRELRSKLMVMSGFEQLYLKSARKLAHGYGLDMIGTITKPASIEDLETWFDHAKKTIESERCRELECVGDA